MPARLRWANVAYHQLHMSLADCSIAVVLQPMCSTHATVQSLCLAEPNTSLVHVTGVRVPEALTKHLADRPAGSPATAARRSPPTRLLHPRAPPQPLSALTQQAVRRGKQAEGAGMTLTEDTWSRWAAPALSVKYPVQTTRWPHVLVLHVHREAGMAKW